MCETTNHKLFLRVHRFFELFYSSSISAIYRYLIYIARGWLSFFVVEPPFHKTLVVEHMGHDHTLEFHQKDVSQTTANFHFLCHLFATARLAGDDLNSDTGAVQPFLRSHQIQGRPPKKPPDAPASVPGPLHTWCKVRQWEPHRNLGTNTLLHPWSVCLGHTWAVWWAFKMSQSKDLETILKWADYGQEGKEMTAELHILYSLGTGIYMYLLRICIVLLDRIRMHMGKSCSMSQHVSTPCQKHQVPEYEPSKIYWWLAMTMTYMSWPHYIVLFSIAFFFPMQCCQKPSFWSRSPLVVGCQFSEFACSCPKTCCSNLPLLQVL